MKHQPVITGLGIVSPIGIGVDKFWEAALAGRSGIGRPTLFDGSKLPENSRLAGEVRDFNPRLWMSAQTAKVAGRFSQFAIAAAKMAMHDSRLSLTPDAAERCMVSIGSSMLNNLPSVHSFKARRCVRGRSSSIRHMQPLAM
jgi:3-oxoacyl-[acyl-carrier-protein] synthase II